MRKTARYCVAALCAMWSSQYLSAAVLSGNAAVSADAQYVDNPRLSPNGGESALVNALDLRGAFAAESEGSVINLAPRARAVRYSNDHELDRNEYLLDAHGARDFSSGTFGLDANIIRDTSLTTEWGGDVYTKARKLRKGTMVSPSWSADLGESTVLRSSYGYNDVAYEDAGNTPLVGYRYRWIDASLGHVIGERNTTQWSAYVSRLDAARVQSRTDDLGVRFSIARDSSETIATTFQAGAHRSHSTQAGVDQWGSGALLEAQVNGTIEHGNWNTVLNRSVEPSGYGVLLQRDAVSLSGRYEMAPQWTGSMSIRALRDAPVQAQAASADRREVRADWRLSWAWAPNWSMVGGVSHVRQVVAADGRAGESSSVLLQVNYRSDEKTF